MLRPILTTGLMFALTGCVALAEGGLLEAGAADGFAARTLASDASAAAATSANTPLFVDGAIDLGQTVSLREAFADLGANRAPLLIRNGAIEMGSQEIASLRGGQLFSRGRLVGYLQRGALIDQASGARVGELRGFIPRGQGVIRFANGVETSSSRSMAVAIIEQTDGGYLVQFPSGEEATFIGPFLALALLPPAVDRHCDQGDRDGFAIRRSGEIIPFDRCDEDDNVFRFIRGNEIAIVDGDELSAVFYSHVSRPGNARIQTAAAQPDPSKSEDKSAPDDPGEAAAEKDLGP